MVVHSLIETSFPLQYYPHALAITATWSLTIFSLDAIVESRSETVTSTIACWDVGGVTFSKSQYTIKKMCSLKEKKARGNKLYT